MEALSYSILSRSPSPTITKNSTPTSIISSIRVRQYISNKDYTRITQNPQSFPNNNPNYKDKKPSNSFLTNLFNSLDNMINKFLDPPLRLSVNPERVLSDNFAPVDELPPTECQVIHGSLPPCLDGAYIRNGPNPQFLPDGPHHFLDGDGMLHCIRISQGRATLCSRYVKTYKYMVEKESGSPVVPNMFGAMHGLAPSIARLAVFTARVLAGHYNPNDGIGLANTSLAFFGGKLYALCESDLPYVVNIRPDGDVITTGRQDFDGKLSMNMTSHPKIDPDTKEAFAFRYSSTRPYLTFFRFDSDGNKQQDVPIFSMKHPSLVHDLGITKNYAIFCEIQIGLNFMEMIRGGSLVCLDTGKVPRIGIIPRNAKDESEMRWFDVPGFNNLHVVNAWEEEGGDAVVLVAPNILSLEHFFDRVDLVHASMEKVRIDLKTGNVSRYPLSTRSLDFGVINPAYVVKKSSCKPNARRTEDSEHIWGSEIGHWSVGERRDYIVASQMYNHGCFGGEPFFVAKEPNNPEAKEDEGYIVSFVHDENTGESRFLVMDAQSPTLEIVAIVELPRRVPYGLHGLFIRESDLRKL